MNTINLRAGLLEFLHGTINLTLCTSNIRLDIILDVSTIQYRARFDSGHTTKGALGIPRGLTSICCDLLLELEATVDIFCYTCMRLDR